MRHNLLGENRFSRYLLYALGEIILVVIGILIALQINTWNQERLLQKEEVGYLKRIIGDLELDLQALEGVRINYETRLILGSNVLSLLGPNNLETLKRRPGYQQALAHIPEYTESLRASFGRKFYLILAISRFSQTENAYQEMLDNGKIAIIQDESLKLDLQKQYKQLLNTRSFQDEVVMHIQHAYREALSENGISTLSEAPFEEIYPALSDKKTLTIELENYLQISEAQLVNYIYADNSIANNTRQLISKIKNYLVKEK